MPPSLFLKGRDRGSQNKDACSTASNCGDWDPGLRSPNPVSNPSHQGSLSWTWPHPGVPGAELSSGDSSFSCRRTSEGHTVHLLCAREHGRQQCHRVLQCYATKFKGRKWEISTKLPCVQGKRACFGACLFRTFVYNLQGKSCQASGENSLNHSLGDKTQRGYRVHLVQLCKFAGKSETEEIRLDQVTMQHTSCRCHLSAFPGMLQALITQCLK